MTALAQPFLASALISTELVIGKISVLEEQLRSAKLLTGSQRLPVLHLAKINGPASTGL